MGKLDGAVAVVAGATRGAGRGLAVGLGEAGATVYCTGRSTRGHPSPYHRPETIEETAERVSQAGGEGIAVRVDHTIPDEVHALVERVTAERGRIDLLVNTLAGEDPEFNVWASFWESDPEQVYSWMRRTVFAHLLTARHVAPVMMKRRRGLIVEVGEGDMLGLAGSVVYDLVKSSVIRLGLAMADELRRHRVTAVAVTPGFLRSERMLEYFGVTEATWREGGKKDPDFLESETPLFLGRGVAALAADRSRFKRTGQLLSSWQLARDYGVVDADGRRPDWGTHFRAKVPAGHWVKKALARSADRLGEMERRIRWSLGEANGT
jgi:NAD(P)-dependent dehydrogenase (short-subunit alcohol dehydrogenase family)